MTYFLNRVAGINWNVYYVNDMKLTCFSCAFLLTVVTSSRHSSVTETNGNSDSDMSDAQPETGDEMKVRGEQMKAARGGNVQHKSSGKEGSKCKAGGGGY